MFNDKLKAKFIKHKGKLCPICGSHKIFEKYHIVVESGVEQRMYCESCGIGWTNVYTLTDINP
jgi:transposase-like protein